MKTIEQEITSLSKTINSRLLRLQRAGLPHSAEYRLAELSRLNSKLVTAAGFVSTSTRGMTERQKTQKLKWMRDLLKNIETVPQAREQVRAKSIKWGISESAAAEYLRAGRVFTQVVGYKNGLFDSEQVQKVIQEFEHAPDLPELIDRLYETYGRDIQDEISGRGLLLEWMCKNDTIPDGVRADYDDGVIKYIDDDGNFIEN